MIMPQKCELVQNESEYVDFVNKSFRKILKCRLCKEKLSHPECPVDYHPVAPYLLEGVLHVVEVVGAGFILLYTGIDTSKIVIKFKWAILPLMHIKVIVKHNALILYHR